MKSKLCCIFNTPSVYRELIYKEIDKQYDCEWYFEDTDNRLKVFDTKQLNQVKVLHAKSFSSFYTVKGVVSLLWKSKAQNFLMMGHSRNLSTTMMMVVKNLFFRQKKTYLWTHGWYGKESCFERLWKKFLMWQADGIFMYGNYARDIAVKNGINPSKIHVIHNSLNYYQQLELRNEITPSDVYSSHFGNDNPVIVMIGRINLRKKLGMLIQAVSDLKQKGEFYNIVLIGDGEDKAKLQQQVVDYGLSDQVWFYGPCYDDKTNAELLYNADMCVVPGDIGLTAIHALMFGCPAMSHDYYPSQGPEFEAIQEGKTGCFFKHEDVVSLADTLSKWFHENSGKRDKVRQACFDEIDATWNPNYQMKVFESVLK